jgi:hypothetical protein
MGFHRRYISRQIILDVIKSGGKASDLLKADALIMDPWSELFFKNYKENLIIEMIKLAESTPLSDLEAISKRKPYKEVIKMGKEIIPYLLKRDLILWDRGLSELTDQGLNPLEHSTSVRSEYWKKWAKENGYQ